MALRQLENESGQAGTDAEARPGPPLNLSRIKASRWRSISLVLLTITISLLPTSYHEGGYDDRGDDALMSRFGKAHKSNALLFLPPRAFSSQLFIDIISGDEVVSTCTCVAPTDSWSC